MLYARHLFIALSALLLSVPSFAQPYPAKLGKPYQVSGVWYTPTDDQGYDETGVASWYGTDFQGKPTSSGELFDMNDVTAAHRTLPMPSFAEVTNLDNSRQIVVRINDRGPFKASRILDLSRRAAQLLGIDITGNVKVTGSLEATLDVKAGTITPLTEISLLTHTHTTATPGNPTSPPLP